MFCVTSACSRPRRSRSTSARCPAFGVAPSTRDDGAGSATRACAPRVGHVVLDVREALGLRVLRPDALRAAEIGDAGLGRDARAGQRDDARAGADQAWTRSMTSLLCTAAGAILRGSILSGSQIRVAQGFSPATHGSPDRAALPDATLLKMTHRSSAMKRLAILEVSMRAAHQARRGLAQTEDHSQHAGTGSSAVGTVTFDTSCEPAVKAPSTMRSRSCTRSGFPKRAPGSRACSRPTPTARSRTGGLR